MNGVPGVIAFESHDRFTSSSSAASPRRLRSSSSRCSSSWCTLASCAERKRRERCWFILARGATPSIASMSSFRGRIMSITRSVYLNTSTIISSSVSGAGFPSGCVHGCTIPFMSRYRQSNSSPLGFGRVLSIGSSTSTPSSPVMRRGSSSSTLCTILGYFFESHRNSAGTPCSLAVCPLRVATYHGAVGPSGVCRRRDGGAGVEFFGVHGRPSRPHARP